MDVIVLSLSLSFPFGLRFALLMDVIFLALSLSLFSFGLGFALLRSPVPTFFPRHWCHVPSVFSLSLPFVLDLPVGVIREHTDVWIKTHPPTLNLRPCLPFFKILSARREDTSTRQPRRISDLFPHSIPSGAQPVGCCGMLFPCTSFRLSRPCAGLSPNCILTRFNSCLTTLGHAEGALPAASNRISRTVAQPHFNCCLDDA